MHDTISGRSSPPRDGARDHAEDTYFLVWRSILDKAHFADPWLLKVWLWCLAKASYRERVLPVRTGRGTSTVKLDRGQFLFGRKSASQELNMPEGSVRDRMARLRDLGSIDIQPDTHFSIVTVTNFEDYQPPTRNARQANRHPTDTQPTPKRHPSATNNEGYKGTRANEGYKQDDDEDGAGFVVREEEMDDVLFCARRILKVVPIHRQDPEQAKKDKSLLVKTAILEAREELSERDVEICLEAIRNYAQNEGIRREQNPNQPTKARLGTPAAYFHTQLSDKAKDPPFNTLLARLRISQAEVDRIYREAEDIEARYSRSKGAR